ncbi:DNA adenine methylase [Catenulispora sp. EB89]|uniref:DNA adenine methylase n=1 Tax=Catenulispora sp. EB89 TaxID=3156257 RepID=UPI003512FC65
MADAQPAPLRDHAWPAGAVLQNPASLSDTKLFGFSVISPLRYPGAKRQLVPVIETLIAGNIPPPKLLVEPFCGGATTTLRLLGSGAVEHGILADVDPLVAAFWQTAAFDSAWLVTAMRELTITVAEWDRWRATEPSTARDRALKCLFLNRTTFSGILHGQAGPIGGRAQESDYKIDCRFGFDGLERRIKGIADLAATGRLLDVWECDWRESLTRVGDRYGELEEDEIIFYFDPPYVEKAPFLYDWSFKSDEHTQLAKALKELTYRWLLSYDDTASVRELYGPSHDQAVLHVSHRYTAAGSEKRTVRDELLVTNLKTIPESDRYRMIVDGDDSANDEPRL